MDYNFFPELIATIILSGLVGLEREKKSTEKNKGYFAGFRSFILIGLIGTISYWLSDTAPVLSIIMALTVLIMISISYYITANKYNQIGVTSELAGIIVFIIGYLTAKGDLILSTSITLLLVALLHFKTDLHKIASKIKDIELISTIQFIFIAFIILRILPNQAFGPFDFFNPFFVWLMIVFISAISFVSYIATKCIGSKYGITLTGFFAGLVSSTALTLSFSEQSKKTLKIINPYVLAIIIAQCGMLIRVTIEVAVINPRLLPTLLPPFIAMFIVGIIGIFYINKRSSKDQNEDLSETIELENPFRLWPAIKFGTLFALILLFGKIANHYFGGTGIYTLSLISGLVDLDAITISLSSLSNNGLDPKIATNGITIAAFTNTIVKGSIFLFLGAKKPGKKIMAIFLIMILLASIVMLFT